MVLEEKKPAVKDIKAADPGLGFTLYTQDGSPINSRINITVVINNGPYSTSVLINQMVTETEITVLVPFGDPNWNNETGKPLSFSITVSFLDASNPGQQTIQGAVMADQSTFAIRTNLAKKLASGQTPPIRTDGQFMLGSDDGNYVGVLTRDGNFSVFAQYVTGTNTLTASLQTKPGTDSNSFPVAEISVSSDGYVKIFNQSALAYQSHESRRSAWLVVDHGNLFLQDEQGSTQLTVPFQKMF